MKTVTRNGDYLRLEDKEAESKVRVGWKYCSKSDWKLNVRDFGKSTDEVEPKPKKKSKKK